MFFLDWDMNKIKIEFSYLLVFIWVCLCFFMLLFEGIKEI